MSLRFPRFVYVMAFTGSHFEEARNELASLERTRVGMMEPSEIHIYTRLKEGAEFGGLDVRVFELELPGVDVMSAEADWGTTGFSHIVVGKFNALLKTLENEPDAHIVWMDTDLFFFKDPRSTLLHHSAVFPTAIAHFQSSYQKHACTGFFHLPPSYRAAQKQFLVAGLSRLQKHIGLQSKTTGVPIYKDDETCMNEELRTGEYPFSFLAPDMFPTGLDYFTKSTFSKENAVLVHNNYIKGLDAKVNRLKENGLWLIPDINKFQHQTDRQMTLRSWINGLQNNRFQWDDLIFNHSTTDGKDGITHFPIGYQLKGSPIGSIVWSHVRSPEHRESLIYLGVIDTTDVRRRGYVRRSIVEHFKINVGIENEILSRDEYYRRLGRSKFVISPEGNGIDCHRHYEALIMGAIPIVEDSPLIRKKYRGCPILFTQDRYSSLALDSIHSLYESLLEQEFDFSALFLSSYSEQDQQQILSRSAYWTLKMKTGH